MALTTLQHRAIVALLSSRTIEAAAETAGCTARSIRTWMAKDEEFQQELAAAEGAAIDLATRQLIGLQDSAITVFAGILANRYASDSVRLRAAQSVLDYMMRMCEVRNLEERIARLERNYEQGD